MFVQKPCKLSFIANYGIILWHDKWEILKQEYFSEHYIEKHGKQLKQHTSKMSGSCFTYPRVINNELLLNVITLSFSVFQIVICVWHSSVVKECEEKLSVVAS